MHGKLYIAPIAPTPEFQVLDVGTAPGAWALEFARSNPSIQVTGMDMSAIRSTSSVPTNCHFLVKNAEQDWDFSEPFDFIHSRFLFAGIRDWPSYFRRCFDNLKPGGWVEAKECDFPWCCDDDSAKPDSGFIRWSNFMREAMEKDGLDTVTGDHFESYLSAQGFMNVHNKVLKWPSNPWPEDEVGRQVGRLQVQNLSMALETASTIIFKKNLNWTKQQVEAVVQEARKDLYDLEKHIYVPIHLYCAQKPAETRTQ